MISPGKSSAIKSQIKPVQKPNILIMAPEGASTNQAETALGMNHKALLECYISLESLNKQLTGE